MTKNNQTVQAPQSALITGSTGFIGRHLVRRLLKDNWSVHVLIRPESDRTPLAGLPKACFHIYDGSIGSIQSAITACQPDSVFHLATQYITHHEPEQLQTLIDANIILGAQLLEIMSREKTGCLINAGTTWQNYQNSDYRPVNLYAAMKQAFEDLLAFYTDDGDLRAVTLRLFDTYGPDDPRNKLMPYLVTAASSGEEVKLSPGEQLIDLLYIDDVINGFLTALDYACKMPEPGHAVFALGNDKRHTLQEVVEIFSRVTKASLNVNWGARPYRPREIMIPWTNGIALPDWRPTVTLEEGIRLHPPQSGACQNAYGRENKQPRLSPAAMIGNGAQNRGQYGNQDGGYADGVSPACRTRSLVRTDAFREISCKNKGRDDRRKG